MGQNPAQARWLPTGSRRAQQLAAGLFPSEKGDGLLRVVLIATRNQPTPVNRGDSRQPARSVSEETKGVVNTYRYTRISVYKYSGKPVRRFTVLTTLSICGMVVLWEDKPRWRRPLL
jgi:hypothetical protein